MLQLRIQLGNWSTLKPSNVTIKTRNTSPFLYPQRFDDRNSLVFNSPMNTDYGSYEVVGLRSYHLSDRPGESFANQLVIADDCSPCIPDREPINDPPPYPPLSEAAPR